MIVVPLREYQEIVQGAEDPNVAVALRVVDGRPSKLAGEDGLAIGILGDDFGASIDVRVTDPARARSLVRAATKDGLRLARVAVFERAPRILVATVREFWMDERAHRGPRVLVQLELQDRNGAILWRDTALGFSGGVIISFTARSGIAAMFQRALTSYADAASGKFGSPDFQRHLF